MFALFPSTCVLPRTGNLLSEGKRAATRPFMWLALIAIGLVHLSGCDVLEDGPTVIEPNGNTTTGPDNSGNGGTTDPDEEPPDPDDEPPDPNDEPDDPEEEPPSGVIRTIVDVSTEQANGLTGLTFAANGMIYVAGHRGAGNAKRTVIGRFRANGTPDPAFGGDGFVSIDLDGRRSDDAAGIVELTGGDVLVAVNVEENRNGQSVYLLRFDDDGTQRRFPIWGNLLGEVEVVFGWRNSDNNRYRGRDWPNDTVRDMQLDRGAGERVVLFGSGPAPEDSDRVDLDRYVARLSTVDGTPDPAFNSGNPYGYHSVDEFFDYQRLGLVGSDGSIVSAGYSDFGKDLGAYVVLFKLTAAGNLDNSFGNFVLPNATTAELGLLPRAGVAVFNPFADDRGVATAFAAARQSSGNYVTTGNGLANRDNGKGTPDLVSFRLQGSGIDSSWATGGARVLPGQGASDENLGADIVALPDDRTAHVGSYHGNAAVYVLTAEGMLDTRVDGDGIIELAHPDIQAPLAKATLSPDGTRIAATTDTDSAGARFIVLQTED